MPESPEEHARRVAERKKHRPTRITDEGYETRYRHCAECHELWPCQTARDLPTP